MKVHRAIGMMVVLIAAMTVMLDRCARAADQPPLVPSQEQPEVLTRGPVHEAFAEPVTLDNQTGLVVPRQPPPDIQEVPPAQRPEGDNFVWVPGYWSWDTDRNDFVWVSACWRVAPPNRYWVPGYWSAVAGRGGWEWVPGFWASAQTQEVQELEYLPAPPAPVDVEPVGQPPDLDSTWVPGCWYWRDSQYIRRPGYWMRQQPDWIWAPSHYRWTPRGYVFVDGHWDYSLERRGVLFAPVYFPQPIYSQVGYSYSPTICIDIGLLNDCMFVYPRYCHYYFGDYYDDRYVRVGIIPRLYTEHDHSYYDPIYTHERWRFSREDKNWEEHQRQEYDRRRGNRDLRPAQTYRDMETRVARLPEAQRSKAEVAKPLATIASRNTGPIRYESLKTDDRQKITRQAADSNKFRDERGKWEANARANPAAARLPVATTPPAGQRQTTPAPTPERRDTTAGGAPATPIPAPEPRTTAPPTGQREPMPGQVTPVPTPERQGNAAGRAPATPTPDQRERTTPSPEPRVTAPPSGQRETTPERTAPERRPPAASAEPRTPSTPTAQRESHATQSERVQIPRPPVMAKPAAAEKEKAPPPRPADERQDRSDGRDDGQRSDR